MGARAVGRLMPSPNLEIPPELKEVLMRGIGALNDLPTSVGVLMDRYAREPQSVSKAYSEREEFPGIEAVQTAHLQGTRLVSHTGSHMWLLHRGLTEPALPIGCWTAARGVLESGAWAAWLLDPSLDALGRIERSMNVRLRDIWDEGTWIRAATTSGVPEEEAALKGAEEHRAGRESMMLKRAESLGIQVKRSRKGNLVGFGEAGIPSTTSVVKESFDETHLYQLLSAMVHGRSWAAHAMSFSPLPEKNTMTESLDPQRILFLIVHCMEWFARPAWHLATLNGWNMDEFTTILEEAYSAAGMADHTRFWR